MYKMHVYFFIRQKDVDFLAFYENYKKQKTYQNHMTWYTGPCGPIWDHMGGQRWKNTTCKRWKQSSVIATFFLGLCQGDVRGIFIIFIKQSKFDDLLANKKSRRAFYTFHIVPGLQNIDFYDFEIVYTSRLIFSSIS